MAIIKNAITIPHGFNVSAEAPLDSRTVVQFESDLTDPQTWGNTFAPIYNGLVVSVIENHSVWLLVNKAQYTSLANGWKRLDQTSSDITISGDDVEE